MLHDSALGGPQRSARSSLASDSTSHGEVLRATLWVLYNVRKSLVSKFFLNLMSDGVAPCPGTGTELA